MDQAGDEYSNELLNIRGVLIFIFPCFTMFSQGSKYHRYKMGYIDRAGMQSI